MRRSLSIVVLTLLLAPALARAQVATLTVPVTRASETQMKVRDLSISPSGVGIDVSVQDGSSNEIRVQSYIIPDPAHPTATVVNFLTALINVRATETGTDPRKANFRILGYLVDQGYITGVSLAP